MDRREHRTHRRVPLPGHAERLDLAQSDRAGGDWIEPETLFWAAWKALPGTHKSAIAGEIVESFAAYVENARQLDPRRSRAPRA